MNACVCNAYVVYKYAYMSVIQIGGQNLLWPLCLRKWKSVLCTHPLKQNLLTWLQWPLNFPSRVCIEGKPCMGYLCIVLSVWRNSLRKQALFCCQMAQSCLFGYMGLLRILQQLKCVVQKRCSHHGRQEAERKCSVALMAFPLFAFLFYSGPWAMEQCYPHSRQVFIPQLILSLNT